jgi:PleD family two-component response regulator
LPHKPTEAPTTVGPQALTHDPKTEIRSNEPHECPTQALDNLGGDSTNPDETAQIPGEMRVLLVEDNEINLKLLVAYMRKLKLDHATAINGLEALNVYKEANGQFDVIFMGLCPLPLRKKNTSLILF